MATGISPSMSELEQLLLRDDGVDRWIIKGQLRERHSGPGEPAMTLRNRFHSKIMARVAAAVIKWRDAQPEPRGDVLCGEAGFRIAQDPVTNVGIDVAYVSPKVLANQSPESTIIEGIPLLAVEILSPSNTTDEIDEKIDAYLSAGVPLVWIINPHRRTATVYRPDQVVQTVNENETLSGYDALPGFEVMLGELFR